MDQLGHIQPTLYPQHGAPLIAMPWHEADLYFVLLAPVERLPQAVPELLGLTGLAYLQLHGQPQPQGLLSGRGRSSALQEITEELPQALTEQPGPTGRAFDQLHGEPRQSAELLFGLGRSSACWVIPAG